MATRLSAESLLGEERVERELEELRSQVQREKEKVRSYFHQLHLLLAAREESVLRELDEIVDRVRAELTEKRALLQQLNTAREDLERDLTENKLRELLQKNVRSLEDGIGEVLGGEGLTVRWVEVEWNVEGVEVSVSDVCKVVCLKEKPVQRVDYSVKVRPVWSRVTGGKGPDQISSPMQIAIDNTTQNIFVPDLNCPRIQVFNSEGNLHSITDGIVGGSTGIALTNEFIFVARGGYLLKLNKSSNKLIESVETDNIIWGIEVDEQTNIYGCEYENQSIVVFDMNLKFLRRIKLKYSHLQSNTKTHSMKLYQNNMYVMFVHCSTSHLQIFSLEGDLIRCLMPKGEIKLSYFFTIDEVGNIIVADYFGNQIKIFNNEGDTIHTITNEDLTENEKFYFPIGVALDNSNRIIVAHLNPNSCLQAF